MLSLKFCRISQWRLTLLPSGYRRPGRRGFDRVQYIPFVHHHQCRNRQISSIYGDINEPLSLETTGGFFQSSPLGSVTPAGTNPLLVGQTTPPMSSTASSPLESLSRLHPQRVNRIFPSSSLDRTHGFRYLNLLTGQTAAVLPSQTSPAEGGLFCPAHPMELPVPTCGSSLPSSPPTACLQATSTRRSSWKATTLAVRYI